MTLTKRLLTLAIVLNNTTALFAASHSFTNATKKDMIIVYEGGSHNEAPNFFYVPAGKQITFKRDIYSLVQAYEAI